MSSMNVSNLTKTTLKKMFEENKRFDSRSLMAFRDLEIEFNVSNKAEGSARIKLGKTDVVVGVKLAPGTPYPDSPDKGNITVSGDLLPLASPRFEAGPPDFQGIELPRLVDRAIREAKIIDLSKLVIKEGEKVWTVYIDVYPINDDGNLIDAATLGAVVALKKSMVPELTESGNVDYDKEPKHKLPLTDNIIPLSFSFFKIGNSIIIDPTREEEEACDGRLTFGVSKSGSEYFSNSCQKAGNAMFTQKEINMIMDEIPKLYEQLMKKLKNYI